MCELTVIKINFIPLYLLLKIYLCTYTKVLYKVSTAFFSFLILYSSSFLLKLISFYFSSLCISLLFNGKTLLPILMLETTILRKKKKVL